MSRYIATRAIRVANYLVTEAVLHHDGVPVKTVGDGLLAFFSGRDAEARALGAAADKLSDDDLARAFQVLADLEPGLKSSAQPVKPSR